MSTENATVQVTTNNSITVIWQHLFNISTELKQHYGYFVKYKEHDKGTVYQTAINISYNSTAWYHIDNLTYNTEYDILIEPFRTDRGEIQTGRPYPVITEKTGCIAPAKPVILNASLVPSDRGLDRIAVTFKNLTNVNPHCNRIEQFKLFYTVDNVTGYHLLNFTNDQFAFQPKYKGEYTLRLVATNNEGYESSSEIKTTSIKLCNPQHYGANCEHKCGHCKNGSDCDQTNGTCANGCEMWWLGTKCDKYFSHSWKHNETITVVSKNLTTITVRWQPIVDIPPKFEPYLGYSLKYKKHYGENHYMEALTRNYSDSPSLTITNLTGYTPYDIVLVPFRRYDGITEYGTPYPTIVASTKCREPEPLNITKLQLTSPGITHLNVTVYFQDINSLNPHCEKISNLTVLYKLREESDYKSQRFRPVGTKAVISVLQLGVFDVQLVVENNEGFRSTSNVASINVTECPHQHYGIRCQKICGRCKDRRSCHPLTGACKYGCQQWWMGEKCQLFIEMPIAPNENLTLVSRTHDSITIKWPKLGNISDYEEPHVGYAVLMRPQGEKSFSEVVMLDYRHTSNMYRLEELSVNTVYDIQVVPYRFLASQTQLGDPYPMLTVRTLCYEPAPHEFVDVKLIPSDSGMPSIFARFLNLSYLDAYCDQITNVTFSYKLKEETNFTTIQVPLTQNTMTILPQIKGVYEMKLDVLNSGGHTSSSDLIKINVSTCNPGYYGSQCKQTCGKCLKPKDCFHEDGTCLTGCHPWWFSSKCDKYIKPLNHSNETFTLKSKTSNNVTVTWQPIRGVESELKTFYGYSIQYKERGSNANYAEAVSMNYSSKPIAVIENLTYHTWYDIKLVPYRTTGNQTDYGNPYPVLEVKTNCVAPEQPVIYNATVFEDEESDFADFLVLFQDVADMKPGCDNITNITLLYKQVDADTYLTEHIHLGETSHRISHLKLAMYEVRLHVRNNEGYESISDNVTVGHRSCSLGYYGMDCKPCGYCKDGKPCSKVTGYCRNGCAQWITGDRCELEIVKPNIPNNEITPVQMTSTNITIGWKPIPGVTPDLYKYYEVTIFLSGLGKPVRFSVPYTGNSTVISPLTFNTNYNIRIQLSREQNNIVDKGGMSDTISVKTKCVAPKEVKIQDTKQTGSGFGLPKITVVIKDDVMTFSECMMLTNVTLRYKRKGEADWHENHFGGDQTDLSFTPKTAGEYLFQVVGYNDEGFASFAPIHNLTVTCNLGYYGTKCQKNCGHCRKLIECNSVTGDCTKGCQTWWLGKMCDSLIDLPKIYNETARVTSKSNTSLSVAWQPLYSIKLGMEQFYGYTVKYKRLGDNSEFTEIASKTGISNFSGVIQDLTPFTRYAIQIVPFRKMDNSKDYGTPYPTLTGMTTCGVPKKPAKPNVEVTTGEYGMTNITMHLKNLTSADAGCDNITDLVLRYKLANEDTYHVLHLDPSRDNTVDIYPREEGLVEYEVIIRNNENYESSSGTLTIMVTMKCAVGYYGQNCKEKCGQCKDSPTCDKDTGACPNGCQQWWTGSICDKYIEMPKHNTIQLMASGKRGNAVIVKWKHISNITSEMEQHYGYSLQYKIHDSNESFTEATTLNLTRTYAELIPNLKYNTVYDIRVILFKSHGKLTHYSTEYEMVSVKTGCGEPEKPEILNVTLIPSVSSLPNISVTIESITKELANCDNITSIKFLYKLKQAANFTVIHLYPGENTFVIVPEEAGDYLLKLVIENNEGFTATSDLKMIKVERSLLLSMMSMILPGAILTALVAVLITVTAAVLCKGSSTKFRT